MKELDSLSMDLARRDLELAEEREVNKKLRRQIEDRNKEIFGFKLLKMLEC